MPKEISYSSYLATARLCLFVAEHDDHHLATITGLLRSVSGGFCGS